MKKVDIGLDIGIASVGFAVTDIENLNIILHGVRLFETVDNPKDSKLANETRREKRSMRRQINRRRTLRRDFVKLLIDEQLLTDITFDLKGKFVQTFLDRYIENQTFKKQLAQAANDFNFGVTIDPSLKKGLGSFVLRKKGLTGKLSKAELFNVLYWYINHRGFKYTLTNEKEAKLPVDHNKLPLENQLAFISEYKYLNGSLNRSFKSQDYQKEIQEIFAHQDLSPEFQAKFFKLFTRQRDFADGPNDLERVKKIKDTKVLNEILTSKFNRFYRDETTGEIKAYDSMWEQSIGRCTYYPDQYRAPKDSLTAQVFNLLNDLNNVYVKDDEQTYHLDQEQKLELIKKSFVTINNTNVIMKQIQQWFDLEDDDKISGYRITPDENPLFTPLGALKIIKALDKKPTEFFETFFKNGIYQKNNFLDQLVDIFSVVKPIEKRIEKIKNNKQLSELFNNEEIQQLANVKGAFSQTHSLSYKAMQEMIQEMIHENRNQMQIAEEKFNDNKLHLIDHLNGNHLSYSWINEIIDTPTVKRSLRQSVRVLNALFDYCKKHHLEIRDIVIEMARENNNKAARDKIKNSNKYFAQINKNIEGYTAGKDITNQTKNKIWLWEQQEHCDAYTGEKIDVDDIINHPGNYDIDHIIPRSQVFDNSRENKVLTKQKINADKGKRTPYQFLKPQNKFEQMKKLWKKWYLNPRKERAPFKSKKKYEFITTKIDFSKPENAIGFIGRNLVDTRYTTKAVLQVLNDFKKLTNHSWNIKTVNGKMTSFARSQMERGNNTLLRPEGIIARTKDGKKSRIWHGHHAEDAYIVTILNSYYAQNKGIEKILSNPYRKYKLFEKEQISADDAKINTEYSALIDNILKGKDILNQNLDNVQFSRMVFKKKKSTKLFNETLYKGKEILLENNQKALMKIKKINIFELDKKGASEYFDNNGKNADKVSMKRHNLKLYQALQEIYFQHQDTSHPFKEALGKIDKNDQKKHFLEITYTSPKGKQITSRVANINVDGEIKKQHEIIKPSNQNNLAFYESMDWVRLDLYHDAKGKFKIIPISAANATFDAHSQDNIKIKKESINKFKEFLNIPLENQLINHIYKGDILEDLEGNLYYVAGHDYRQSSLEVKHLEKIHEGNQIYKTMNKALLNWHRLDLDMLGQKRKSEKLF